MSKWARYEVEKAKLKLLRLPPDEYEEKLKAILQELKL